MMPLSGDVPARDSFRSWLGNEGISTDPRLGKIWGIGMRRALSLVMMAALGITIGGPLAAPSALAQSATVDAWVEVGTSTPDVGCVVDVSAEVRSGGAGLGGAEVTVVLSDDTSGDVISSDSSVTDGAGVGWLVLDTGAGYDGQKTWMEVLVNGAYIGGRTIWITGGGACFGASSLLDLSGDVPTVTDTVVPSDAAVEEQASSSGGEVIIPGIITYSQQRSLSCEYAAISIATGTLGNWVSEYDVEAQIGLSDNPHWGYRGNITGSWGNTTDYGIYAEALVPALNAYGFNGEVFYGGRDALMAQIDAGHPTLVWLGLWGDQSAYEYTADGTRYQVTAGMHVMVAYGYDGSGVYLSDPASGSIRYYDWGTFHWMWDVMDDMALGVSW